MNEKNDDVFPTVFICAMTCEREAVCAALSDCVAGTLAGRTLVTGRWQGRSAAVLECGIGKVNAATAVQLAVDRLGATCVISAGVAGGLRPTMKVGEVYAVGGAVQYDFDLSQVDDVPVGQVDGFSTRIFPFTVPPGLPAERLATGDHFRGDEADYPLLVDDLDAGLRDMEGAAVAQAAVRAGIVVMGYKAVSNVRGQGSMPGQYRQFRAQALAALTSALARDTPDLEV